MEFITESITNITKITNIKNIDMWFDQYVYKNSELYKRYNKSKKYDNMYNELPIKADYQIWFNKLSTSNITIKPVNKINCFTHRNNKHRVYADGVPIAIIDLIDGKYMYIDIPFQGLTMINKEYIEQFY